MTRSTMLLGASALLAAVAATPVLAQDAGVNGPGGPLGLTPDPHVPDAVYRGIFSPGIWTVRAADDAHAEKLPARRPLRNGTNG